MLEIPRRNLAIRRTDRAFIPATVDDRPLPVRPRAMTGYETLNFFIAIAPIISASAAAVAAVGAWVGIRSPPGRGKG